MKKNSYQHLFLFLLLTLAFTKTFAWNNSIELGYGFSHDPNNIRYNNYGVMLSGDLFPIYRSPLTFWSVTGSLGQWHTNAPQNKNLTTAAASLALRLYPFYVANNPFYFLGSVGPALLSKRKFGVNTQASNLTLQTNLGLGMEFDPIDVNLRLEHFSNANIAKPNEGFNILYLLSIGYLF